jgi:LysM repeat protein
MAKIKSKVILYLAIIMLIAFVALNNIEWKSESQQLFSSSSPIGVFNGVPPKVTPILVSPNQILSATRDASAETTMLRYVVQNGDTLDSIAVQFNTSVNILAEANSINKTNPIYVGQELKIVVRESN